MGEVADDACEKACADILECECRPVEKFEGEQIGSYSDKWYLEINAVRYYLFEYGAVDIFAKQRICHNVGYVGERKLVYIVENARGMLGHDAGMYMPPSGATQCTMACESEALAELPDVL